ncbi:MAG TPA: hypothetical protein VFI96_04020, partial [Longimicrobiaceae bacterium]|nr:hypothetical protein [Longimicrobiaceae bacterium]
CPPFSLHGGTMRYFPLVSVLLLAGCSTASLSHQPTTRTPVSTQIETAGGTYNLKMIAEDRVSTAWADTAIGEVWTRLLKAYPALGIELATVDSEHHIAGNQSARLQGRLAGEQFSTYFRCGRSPIGAPLADESYIELNALTQLDSVSGGTVVSTLVQATARPRASHTNPIRCTSTGALEARIAEMVGAQPEG